ncbi:MAG: PIN domain-containing protein [Planctomycetes bacterium]|nr:PIN domain-containing protein [Planctomycetota bacterium]
MSYALDANLLLYASDSRSPHHNRAAKFLKRCSEDPEPLCFAWSTLFAYLQVATHPSVFSRPLAPDEARANVETLLALPQARILTEMDGFWDVFREVTRNRAIRGNLIPDAHLASILRQHGVKKLYTADVDFRRFDFLDVKNPLA